MFMYQLMKYINVPLSLYDNNYKHILNPFRSEVINCVINVQTVQIDDKKHNIHSII